MKIKLYFLLFLSILILPASCSKDNDDGGGNQKPPDDHPPTDTTQTASPYLDITLNSINFTADKDASLLEIKTNKEWNIKCEAEWISFSESRGDSSTAIIIAAGQNKKFKRKTEITVTAADIIKEINVTQAGVSKIEFYINGVKFKFLPVIADTAFYLDGATYLASRSVFLDSYFISETEITNEQWQAVTGNLPYDTENSFPKLPVMVNWKNITSNFIPLIKEISGYKLRLPTENEWEVAARGSREDYNTLYPGSMYVDSVAWYYPNSEGRKHNVAQKLPNELGLYDMGGNVSEWCSDWYAEWTENNPPPSESTNPTGPESGTEKVLRGGDFQAEQFQYDINSCTVYQRNHLPPDIDTEGFLYNGYYHYTGFRLVIAKD